MSCLVYILLQNKEGEEVDFYVYMINFLLLQTELFADVYNLIRYFEALLLHFLCSILYSSVSV